MKPTVEIKKKKAPNKAINGQPLVVSVKTERGNVVSMRQITPSEAKALRNSAYQYLA